MNRFLKRHALDGLLLLPLFAYLFVLTGLPLLSCLVLSFTEGEAGPFPTLANYRLLLRDSQLILALRNTLWLTGLVGQSATPHRMGCRHGTAQTHPGTRPRAYLRTNVLPPLVCRPSLAWNH
jgi:ABC-type sugar transport system permease subunit